MRLVLIVSLLCGACASNVTTEAIGTVISKHHTSGGRGVRFDHLSRKLVHYESDAFYYIHLAVDVGDKRTRHAWVSVTVPKEFYDDVREGDLLDCSTNPPTFLRRVCQ